jgi:hypothetical protein
VFAVSPPHPAFHYASSIDNGQFAPNSRARQS